MNTKQERTNHSLAILARLVEEKMEKERLSLRGAAEQIGISHSTLGRVISLKQIDLETLIGIGHWMDTPPEILLEAVGMKRNPLVAQLAAVLYQSPELANRLQSLVVGIEDGKIKPQVVRDALAYITFRLETQTV